MRSDPFDVGDTVELEGLVKVNDVLTNATTVRCFVTKPRTGAVVEITPVTHPSTGVYQATVVPDESGVWRYRFDSTGPAQTQHDHFTVYDA